MPYVVERILAQGSANADRVFVPTGMLRSNPNLALTSHVYTGFQSKALIVQAGLSLGDIEQYPVIDVTIDGADEWVSSSYAVYSLSLFLAIGLINL